MLINEFSQVTADVRSSVASIEGHEKASRCSLTGKRVVVVEDEAITQLQLVKILRAEGLTVVGRAANGQEAIKAVLDTQPDLVLMDINMPVMDGLEASERILAQTSVCIVILTAFSEKEYQQRAAALGACGYIIKPVTSETLMPELEAALSQWE